MRLAYILPRYGPEIMGGAETLARKVIEQMVQRDHVIEVWTTCAQSLYTWDNVYPPGVEQIEGVTVRRFPVEPSYPYDVFSDLLTSESQYQWVKSLAHSAQLYHYIANHGLDFDFLIYVPYIVGMSYCGTKLHPHKSILWSCLHDELFAYLAPTRNMLKNVTGIVFNTPSEQRLLENKLQIKHPRTVVAGMGFDITTGDKEAFRQEYPQIGEKFFVYAGRLEPSKNVDLLFDYFLHYISQQGPKLDLVLLGTGPLSDGRNHPSIIPLGFIDEQSKRNVLAAATFLCQPSLYESFSIVLMESWAQKRPVLVHERCDVTVDHTRLAQGGLYFANYDDFEGVVEYFLTNPEQGNMMGANGQRYVQQHYNWSMIIDRLEQALLCWLEQME